MQNSFIANSLGKTRREILINLIKLLENEKALRYTTGSNALLDIALYTVASKDEKLMSNLQHCLNTDDLLNDIEHILQSRKIEKLKQE